MTKMAEAGGVIHEAKQEMKGSALTRRHCAVLYGGPDPVDGFVGKRMRDRRATQEAVAA